MYYHQPSSKDRRDKLRETKDFLTNQFIRKSMKKHGDTYGYDNTHFLNMNKLVTITCKEHGDFRQVACNHVRGSGCPKCALIKRRVKKVVL